MSGLDFTKWSKDRWWAVGAEFAFWCLAVTVLHPSFWGAVALLGLGTASANLGQVTHHENCDAHKPAPREPRLR